MMKKYFGRLLGGVSLLRVWWSKDDDGRRGRSDGGVYRIRIEVSGSDGKGFGDIRNVEKVNIRKEKSGDCWVWIDDEFRGSGSYVREGKVKEIGGEGMVDWKEKGSVRMKVRKDGKSVFDERKRIDGESGRGKIGEVRFRRIWE